MPRFARRMRRHATLRLSAHWSTRSCRTARALEPLWTPLMQTFEDASLVLASMPVGPFAMNQMLVGCAHTLRATLVDPGGPPDLFIQEAERRGLEIESIWLTHGHIDHILGLAATKAALDVPIFMHPNDLPMLASATYQGRMFGIDVQQPPQPDRDLADGDTLQLGALTFEVLFTPGHAPGHVCFYAASHGVLIGGDLLFRGSIGRLDLPGCDTGLMRSSLARVGALPAETRVYPGHMEPTTIGEELKANPFLNGHLKL